MSTGADPVPVSSMQTSTQEFDGFHQLVRALSELLALKPGMEFSDIDPMTIIIEMKNYISRSSEWGKYAYKDESKYSTRNLVDRGNGKHNLLILVWTPGKESPIHDHAGSHCIMKILQGSLKETQYNWPATNNLDESTVAPPQPKMETILSRDEVAYITDNHGLHKIANPDPTVYAVSLHLYAPPNAMKEGCRIFDEATGQATHVLGYDLFSEMGTLKDPRGT